MIASFDNCTDTQIQSLAEQVFSDLKDASENQHESEWHEACFAGAVLVAQEMSKRGLKRKEIK